MPKNLTSPKVGVEPGSALTRPYDILEAKIGDRSAKIAVVGAVNSTVEKSGFTLTSLEEGEPDIVFLGELPTTTTFLRPGTLVCLEATSSPGTTLKVVLPLLQATGLKVEKDFFLVYAPERTEPTTDFRQSKATPRVVAGVGPKSQALGEALYRKLYKNVMPVNDINVAEMAKVFENTYRMVNASLLNETAQLCHKLGMNAWEVMDVAFFKGLPEFHPGPTDHHPLPADLSTPLTETASRVNREMPRYVSERILKVLTQRRKLPSQAKILLLGAPSAGLWKELKSHKIKVTFHDPVTPKFDKDGVVVRGKPLDAKLVRSQDLVVILQHREAFDYRTLVKQAKHVFDTRNATRSVRQGRKKITLL